MSLRLVDRQNMKCVPQTGRVFVEYADGSVDWVNANVVYKITRYHRIYWIELYTAWSYTATFEPETETDQQQTTREEPS